MNEVWNCDRLISLVPSSVTFQNLEPLDVWSCGSLVNLLPPSTAKSLVQLKNLKVGGSDTMKEVVSRGGGKATDCFLQIRTHCPCLFSKPHKLLFRRLYFHIPILGPSGSGRMPEDESFLSRLLNHTKARETRCGR